MSKRKSLGEIAYNAAEHGGKANWGPWHKAPPLVRCIHIQIARAVERAVLLRAEAKRKAVEK